MESGIKLSKGQKTAKKILEAASRCISKVGAEKTSITAIANEADLKRSLIAYHFPKKELIFYQVMVHIVKELGQSFAEGQLYPKSRDGLKHVLITYLDYFESRPHYFHCFMHCFYLASIQDKYKELNTEIQNRGINRMLERIREMLHEHGLLIPETISKEFATLLYTNLIGTVMNHYTTLSQTDFSTFKKSWLGVIDKEIDLFLLMVKKEHSQ